MVSRGVEWTAMPGDWKEQLHGGCDLIRLRRLARHGAGQRFPLAQRAEVSR